MLKLYSGSEGTLLSAVSLHTSTESFALYPEQDMHSLKNMVEGYCTAQELYSSVANEAYMLVDDKNKSLYNAYTALLADKLGVSMPALKSISTESLEGAEGISVNHDIALEGFIGNLWEKIKSFFKKIYESIKAFFTKHFTRLGRVKKSLENLKSVLAKTEKAMVPPQELNYTGSLLKRYAGYGTININTVSESLSNISLLTGTIKGINNVAKDMANSGMVDREFFKRFIAVAKSSAVASAKKEDIDKETPGVGASILSSKNRELRSEKKKESQKLGDIVNNVDKVGYAMGGKMNEIAEQDAGSDDENLKAARDQMDRFMKVIVDCFKGIVNLTLVSGKVIRKAVVTEKFELEVDMSSDAEPANGVTPSGKGPLITLVDFALVTVNRVEKDMKDYGQINDIIMKNLTTIDSLISDLDSPEKTKDEGTAKVRKVMNTQIRERLMLMQRFFSAYNKVGKNILELSMESCEGTVDYCLLSLKYFK